MIKPCSGSYGNICKHNCIPVHGDLGPSCKLLVISCQSLVQTGNRRGNCYYLNFKSDIHRQHVMAHVFSVPTVVG